MAYHNAGGDKRGWNRSSAFQCANARRNAGCGHKARYPYAVIEQAILTHIPDFDLRARRQQGPQEGALTNAIAQRADLEQQIANLINMAASGSKSVAQAILAREGELEALDRAIKSLRAEVSQDRAKREPSAVQLELPPLLAAMVGAQGNELYAARVRVSEAIRSIVDRIEFEISKVDGRKVISVFVLGGAKTYGFDGQTGELLGGADITPWISFGALDAAAFTSGDPTRQTALDRISGTPERNSGMLGWWKPFEASEKSG